MFDDDRCNNYFFVDNLLAKLKKNIEKKERISLSHYVTMTKDKKKI